tara:strand:- start:1243 stop:1380 length:138 start_codon:yes stop_codon:yes gene_type:complete
MNRNYASKIKADDCTLFNDNYHRIKQIYSLIFHPIDLDAAEYEDC